MLHSAGHPRGRLALPLVASLALGLAALPALGGVPASHAATARTVARGQGGKTSHAKPLQGQAKITANFITPNPTPNGPPAVVTMCTTAGLLAALNASTNITFACTGTGPYTIDLGDSFKVTGGEALTIDGSDGGRNDVTISGGATVFSTTICPSSNLSGGHQIFYVDFGSSLALNNLTLIDGYAFDSANGVYSGGAVEAFGTFSANRDTFRHNGADDYGGALELATDSSTHGQISTITNSTFDQNYTNCDTGGAIDVDSEGNDGPQQVTLTNDTLTYNTTYDDNGGALYANNRNASLLVSVANSVFRHNQALSGHDGGAIYFNYGNASVSNTLFASNYASDNGGAIYNNTGSSYLTTITNSTFVQNRADSNGGAIYTDTPLRITNSTITRNSSGSDGSAIYNSGSASRPLTLAASTINANTSDTPGRYNGAALVNSSPTGSFSIGTSIVYGNVAGFTATPSECGGTPVPPVTDNGHNLSDFDLTPTTNSCGFTTGTPKFDILVPVGTNIGLGPLGAYGGPILGAPGSTSPTFTERLFAGSPALDQVPTTSCLAADGTTPLTTDQRGTGFVRPFPAGGNCDIGAFEASILTTGNCSAAITFFSGGTAFALRTGSAVNTLMSYLSIKGPGGTITAVPLVPRAGVPDTLVCTTPDPAAALSPSTTTTVTVDAQVVRSTNPSVARLSTVRVVATRTATTETVTVSAINPADNSTGATLYTLTPSVQPQSFAVSLGTFAPFI